MWDQQGWGRRRGGKWNANFNPQSVTLQSLCDLSMEPISSRNTTPRLAIPRLFIRNWIMHARRDHPPTQNRMLLDIYLLKSKNYGPTTSILWDGGSSPQPPQQQLADSSQKPFPLPSPTHLPFQNSSPFTLCEITIAHYNILFTATSEHDLQC